MQSHWTLPQNLRMFSGRLIGVDRDRCLPAGTHELVLAAVGLYFAAGYDPR